MVGVGMQDRIIVHAPLDIFADGPSQHGTPDNGSGPRRRSSRGSVQHAKGDKLGVGSRKNDVGYANRHFQIGQIRAKQKSSPRRAHRRVLPQTGSATPYFIPAPSGTAHVQQELEGLQESMAATGLADRTRGTGWADGVMTEGSPSTANEVVEEVLTPPQWRRVSAVTPSPPYHGHSTCSSVQVSYGHNNQQYHEGRRTPAAEDLNFYRRYPGAHADSVEIGPGDSSPRWPPNTAQQKCHDPSEEPERHDGPETRDSPRREDDDRHGGDRRVEAKFAHLSRSGRRGECRLQRCTDDPGRETYGEGNQQDSPSQGETYQHLSPVRHQGERGDKTNADGRYYDDAPRLRERVGSGDKARTPDDGKSSESIHRPPNKGRKMRVAGVTEHSSQCTGMKRIEFSTGKHGQVTRKMAFTDLLPSREDDATVGVRQRAKPSPKKHRRLQAEGSCEEDHEKKITESLNEALVKSPKDMLLFSKKARKVDYKPCTLKEYRESKPSGYVELGKLQPDLNTDELIAKRANAERIKEFSANLRKINSDTAAAAVSKRGGTVHRTEKGPPQDSRSRGLAFARRIPLPKKRVPVAAEARFNPADPRAHRRADGRGDVPSEPEGFRSRGLTELEALEALHDDMRRKVQAARSIY